VELACDVETGLPSIATDAGKLKIVLRSLVSNALKFTRRGTVTIGARRRAGGVELYVSDTGPGVRRGSFGRIFEPFTQLGDASTRTHGGLGMGLYVARRITDLLGGTIGVSSRVGVGSTFQVWIPATGLAARSDLQPARLETTRPPTTQEHFS
jgi:signal transduction histidine kinase